MAKKRNTASGRTRRSARGSGRSGTGRNTETGKSRFSPATLERFRKALLEARVRVGGDYEALRKEHLRSSPRDASGDLSGYSLHMADAGTDAYDMEFGLSVVSNERNTLYNINQALHRLESGIYGICEACGGRIKAARLKAVPWARLCINCKKKLEEGEGRGA